MSEPTGSGPATTAASTVTPVTGAPAIAVRGLHKSFGARRR